MANDISRQEGLSPFLSKKLQLEVLRSAVSTQIFCSVSGQILDQRTAVLVMVKDGGVMCFAPDIFDKHEQAILRNFPEDGIEIYDGREIAKIK